MQKGRSLQLQVQFLKKNNTGFLKDDKGPFKIFGTLTSRKLPVFCREKLAKTSPFGDAGSILVILPHCKLPIRNCNSTGKACPCLHESPSTLTDRTTWSSIIPQQPTSSNRFLHTLILLCLKYKLTHRPQCCRSGTS